MTKYNPEDWSPVICGIDWRNLRKGQSIPAYKVEEMYHALFNRKDVLGSAEQDYKEFHIMKVKEWLESVREAINEPIVFRQIKGDLVALTDEQAVSYLNGQAFSGLNKHRRSTRRMFTQIDTSNLTQHQRDQLQSNQTRHAFIASAADGARRQAVKIQRQGGKLPKIIPPDL